MGKSGQLLASASDQSVHLQFLNDETSDLTQDLMHDEPGIQLVEAGRHALGRLDELEIYASHWDHLAFYAGNDAMSF